MEKNKIIAVVGAILMAIAGYFLKAPVRDLVCGVEAPPAIASEPKE